MRPLVPVPAELAGRPFTRALAQTYGISARMLRGTRFRRLAREVYACADTPITSDLLCRAACLAMPECVLSHHSAAVALGLPVGVREADEVQVHVTAPVGGRRPAQLSARCHFEELPPAQVVPTRLGPATSPARTFVDRAAELDLPDLVALGDAIVGRGCASLAELDALVAWAGGRRGVVNARAALPLIDGRSRSPMESRTRVVLVLGGCPSPEVNIDILDPDGGWLASGDLVWREARLVVEYDGEVHLSERQRRVDAQRHNQLVAAGWTVLHVTADDVLRRPWALVALVKGRLAATAA